MFTDVNGNRLSELEATADRTPLEETVRLALVELKARSVVLDSAQRANPENAANVTKAQSEFDTANEAYVKAEEANGTPTV